MEVNDRLTEKGQRDFLLIQRAINENDQKAYAELLQHYRDSLYFMMLKMTNNPYDADDLTIEAFGKAFKKLKQYTPDYAFSTWLFKIASNNCIDFLRRNRKNTLSMRQDFEENAENDPAQNIAATTPDPEESVIIDQKIKLMRGVVEKLKPHYKQLVELRYFDELSYEEIAVELNLPLGTVKAQLFRAREFLYNILRGSKEKI
jgi:RNA polymerase sigma-70 factor (ECF subfamily)